MGENFVRLRGSSYMVLKEKGIVRKSKLLHLDIIIFSQ
jgi:hypothetical protein